jgi:hypothetical protein
VFCHKCGTENSEEESYCISCKEQLKVSLLKENILAESDEKHQEPKINNQHVRSPLVWSILVTVFGFFTCCLNPVSIVVGIIAIVFSSRVDEKQRLGDYNGAKSDAKTAMILNWVGFGFLVLAVLIIGILILIGVLSSANITERA